MLVLMPMSMLAVVLTVAEALAPRTSLNRTSRTTISQSQKATESHPLPMQCATHRTSRTSSMLTRSGRTRRRGTHTTTTTTTTRTT